MQAVPAFAASIRIASTPDEVYDLVSDVTRTGEWSPICRWCRWEDGGGPHVGARFTGHNETATRGWETQSRVVAADRGRRFAWEVSEGYVRWSYALAAVDGGTELTETWEFLPAGIAFFHTRYGERAAEQIQERTRAAHEGIPVTLAAIKRIAEEGR